MTSLVSIEQAQQLILDRVPALPYEEVEIGAAPGRVVAEPVRAVADLPPFPSSAMDGFAVRAEDTPGSLPVVHRIAAGRPAPRALRAGEAMGIATGGVVPHGADVVVPIEVVVDRGNSIDVPDAAELGENIRPAGGDVVAGDVVVPAGAVLGATQVGAAAAAGAATVVCARRPRTAVLATGTELQRPGRPLAPGQVYEVNSIMLAAQLRSAGSEVETLVSVEDDEDEHRRALERGLGGDVLVTSGGVSVGPHDLVRGALRALGAAEVFWGVAVKPGKPISFSVCGRTLVFGLPGNPVSSLVGFELFVRPALLALQGAAEPLPRFEPGTLARAVRRNPHRDELVRARRAVRDEVLELDPVRGQDSHMIARAAGADSLVFVPAGEGELSAGAAVRYLRLR